MWEYVIAIAVIVVIVFLYIFTYSLNEKTDKPEGCEDLECTSCHAKSCSNRK